MTGTHTPGTGPVFNIPAGLPFADTLAAGLLAEAGDDPMALARMRVLLPTRRACRVLRESFLRLTGGRPLLLPRMHPIGDVHEDEPALLDAIGLDPSTMIDIPPAMPPLRRQMLLARAIMAAPDLGADTPEQALALAAALARLLDQVHTENKSIEQLQNLVPEDGTHWHVTAKFLRVLSEIWPGLLRQEGMIDAADRRNRLMTALAAAWTAHPPAERVIAAGTTGSIPATAQLLAAIAKMPRGAIVLPGLDMTMDEDSWQAAEDTHPQATLKNLLQQLDLTRADIALWPAAQQKAEDRAPRRWLAAELMRPAPTSDRWQMLHPDPGLRAALTADLSNAIDLYECDTAQEEARLIAVMIRHALETPRRTVAVITPDRRLARRVAAICARWDIAVDDSAGQSLADSPAGVFLRLVLRAALEDVRPGALLALLRHPLCRAGLTAEAMAQGVAALETAALRGPKPPPGFEGLRNRLAERHRDLQQRGQSLDPAADDLLQRIDAALSPLITALRPGAETGLAPLIAAHAQAAEMLASSPDSPGAARLWAGDDGTTAAGFAADILQHGELMPALTAAQYGQMFDTLAASVSVRSPTGLHPRIFILGQLEARLVQADLTILAGLNEGTWPPEPGHDPWLSRSMRRQAGLPVPERGVGLSAHDFVQGFCAPRVVMTRAKRVDGTQTVPARWLQRLDTVLKAAQIDAGLLHQRAAETPPYLTLARTADISPVTRPQGQPRPTPPVALRPRRLSATEIETWLRDPYGIYAKHVLRLRPLEEIEKAPDAAERGTVLHDAISNFVANNPHTLPPDAADRLYDMGADIVARRADEPGFWDFWMPRYRALCTWFTGHEKSWRDDGNRFEIAEQSGQMTLPGPGGDFTLRVRVDRIDRRADGCMAVIDYKSGSAGKYSEKKILSGHLPQLPLTALILKQGGFEKIAAADTGYMGYWVLTGGSTPGETKSLEDDIDTALDTAAGGLADLIAAFDQAETPYIALPRPDHLPDFNDYDHLARVQEWTALGDDAEDAA